MLEAERQRLMRKNSWMLAPALLPAIAPLGVEALVALGARAALGTAPAPLALRSKPVMRPQQGADPHRQIRDDGRRQFARTNGIWARDMQAEVQHSRPLEWSHILPKANPNSPANLWALRNPAHQIANREWAKFAAGLAGRRPTPAEFMKAKLRIDKLVAPYVRTGGKARSVKPKEKDGLL
jgi:hypothetical protein